MLDLLKQNEINVYKTQIISQAIETTKKQKRGMKKDPLLYKTKNVTLSTKSKVVLN